jgi:hypothetical protein
MSARPWTPDEDARLLAGRAARKTHAWIAADLGRPLSSIASRLDTLKIKRTREAALLGPATPTGCSVGQRAHVKEGGPGERKPRNCLCCGKTFASAHAGNRLCNTCRTKSVSPFDHRI